MDPNCIEIPEGLDIPKGKTQFDLVTTYTVQDGYLKPLAIDGVPVPEPEAPEEEGTPEEESAESPAMAASEKAAGPAGEAMGGSAGFMAAIEAALGKGKR